MAQQKTLTAANSIIMLTVSGLFLTPQQIQGFAADDIFDTEEIKPTEVVMGVDGKLSAGYVPTPLPQNFTIQADSNSNDFFEAWYQAMKTAKEVFFAGGIIQLPAIGRSYAMVNGVLSSYKPISDGKKILQPRKYQITWESVLGAPL
jgi:hypothetical protein